MIFKNLEAHHKSSNHSEKNIEYKSALSKDITTLMSKKPLVSSLNMNLKDVASTSESTVTDASSEELTEYPPTKMIRLESSLLQKKDEK